MKLINTKIDVKVVYKNGQKSFVPVRKTTFCGIGWWRVPKEWKEMQKRIESERETRFDSESTLTRIRAFNEKHDPNPKNPYYND